MVTLITACKEISLKKISFTRLKIIGVIILERCQDLQIYLKFGFKSRTWIVLLNVRSWRIVHPRKKNRFIEISFNWLLYKYLPQFLSFKLFLQPPPPPPISDRYVFTVRESDYQPNMQELMEHMRGSRIFFPRGGSLE